MSSSTSSLHTHIFTAAVHIVDPELLTTIAPLFHMQSAHSTICFTKMFARGTSMRDRCLQAEFSSQGPRPTRSGKFLPTFFVPKVLGNLAALFEQSAKICQAMIAI